ncbi:MAG: hypothetical protein JNL32_15885 [Candidatus Kapabacteria bacterium]|nr:hypothetical protein [Candidatus Kapabacteria bacterium]
MKSFIGMLVVLFVSASFSLFAQCSPGFTGPLTATFFYTPSCSITVTYCYNATGGVVRTEVLSIGGSIPCITAMVTDPYFDVTKAVTDAVILHLGTVVTYPSGGNIIPPSTSSAPPTLTFEITTHLCQRLFNDNVNQMMVIQPRPTQTGLCQRAYKVCIDFSTVPLSIVKTFVSATASGLSQCSTGIPEIPNPIPDGWLSECFMTDCE